MSDVLGSLGVIEVEDAQEFGAGVRRERVDAFTQPSLDLTPMLER
jgi:hypothetical protein